MNGKTRIILILSTIVICLSFVFAAACNFTDYVPERLFFFACCDNYLNYPFSPDSPGYVSFLIGNDNKEYVRKLYNIIIKSKRAEKININISEIEVLDFRFFSQTNEIKHFTLMFDFFTKETYILENNNIYSISCSKKLNEAMSQLLETATGNYSDIWRGQSTFAFEEYKNSDFENATFRYNLLWKPFSVANNSFTIFTRPEDIEIVNDKKAIAVSAKIMGYTNFVGTTFFDYTSETWMVEILNVDFLHKYEKNELVSCLSENAVTLILDKNGAVLEAYYGYTRAIPFIQALGL